MQLEAFTNFQRLFSVYDGPAYQDSNAYLNIQPTYLTSDGTKSGSVIGGCKPNTCKSDAPDCNPCANAGFKDSFLPGVRADQLNKLCYLPNAAIGWKQSNGFYYAPAFHSTNLFFDSVGIRHFVTEPLFNNSNLLDFTTDRAETNSEYCYWTQDFFNNFTDIDRETVLNDDDGTLTGLTSPVNQPDITKSETSSVNKETFFDAPTETSECASDLALNKNGTNQSGDPRCPPNTAKTSPYEYVTAAIYPECALTAAPPTKQQPLSMCRANDVGFWGSDCTASPLGSPQGCVGVPLYRQLLTNGEPVGLNQVKRMMGQNTFQRSGLTVNNGIYYIDTTLSKTAQENVKAKSINVFTADQKFDLFFLYANANTRQSYQLFVGKDIPENDQKQDFGQTHVKFGYMNITTNLYEFGLATAPGTGKTLGDLPDGWTSKYDPPSGILTLTTDMSALADDFDFTKNNLGQERCQPATMCSWTSSQCQCNPASPYFDLCSQKNPAGQTICSWSVKDIDCPAQGCPAFQITFPAAQYFKAEDQKVRPTPAQFGFAQVGGSTFDWNIVFNLETSAISGPECNYGSTQPPLACLTPTPTPTP
jgi:hypothetical protein